MSLRFQVFLIFTVVIAVSLSMTVFLVHRSIEAEGTTRIADSLAVGERVFSDKLQSEMTGLERNNKLLANDDALREALFDDPASLQVSLENFLTRLNRDTDAHFMWLLDTGGRVYASAGVLPEQEEFPFPTLIDNAENRDWSSLAIVPIADHLYKLIVVGFFVPVRAPFPSFWLVTGSRLDSRKLASLAAISGLELMLINGSDGTPWAASASKLADSDELSGISMAAPQTLFEVLLSDVHYLAKQLQLQSAERAPVRALLLKSSEDIYRQLTALNTQLMLSGLVVLSIAALVTAVLSRSVTHPLSQLVVVAKAIGRGEYQRFNLVGESAEVSTLANAFQSMQGDIAEREREIEYIAYHDGLTGLPNRNAFVQAIEGHINQKPEQPFAVCVLDFNRFKEINDTLGHESGDLVLKEFSTRLQRSELSTLKVARLGGDEFGLLVSDIAQLNAAIATLQGLTLNPVQIERIGLEISTSIGVSRYPDDGDNANTLLQTADVAMYLAKEEHQPWLFYDRKRDHHSMQRLSLMAELRAAVQGDQMALHFQPKLSLRRDEFCSVECLARWIHPSFGFVNPEEFIGYAEQTGEIKHLTRWVVRAALAQALAWREEGYDLNMGVNISAIDLGDDDFPRFVMEQLDEFGLSPQVLTLEITESGVMRDVDQAMAILQSLSDAGLRLSIDDYGQGYSSMAQLKRLPVQELKIDKAFVLNLTQDSDDLAIVKSTIELAHNMDLDVVAEGVENQRSLAVLESLGCDYAQGYYLSKPLDGASASAWLADNCGKVPRAS